jgi:hypothetical protein
MDVRFLAVVFLCQLSLPGSVPLAQDFKIAADFDVWGRETCEPFFTVQFFYFQISCILTAFMEFCFGIFNFSTSVLSTRQILCFEIRY